MAVIEKNGRNFQHIIVDDTPSEDVIVGPITPQRNKIEKIFFSQRGSGSGTIKLQFKCSIDDDFIDFLHDEDISSGARFVIDTVNEYVEWRAILEVASYSSGTVIFGFDW